MKKVFITGVTGMDGSHLSELLLSKNYEVHGLVRRTSGLNLSRIDHIKDDLRLHYGDVTDSGSLCRILREVEPEEVYNLCAQSNVRTSFDSPEYTANTDAVGALNLIDAAWNNGKPKLYQASTSEMFGASPPPQNEQTPFYPRSPYGTAKLFAYWTVINYREKGMFASNGILYNHEGPRRGSDFVTQKIVRGLVAIKKGSNQTLYLGNLDAKRDWGFAPDYVDGMWRILQHDTPDDFVLATGESHTVREFLDEVSQHLGLTWQDHVSIDPNLYRPTEVDYLLGDYSKAKRILGWEPKVKFRELVKIMVEAELERTS